MGCGGVGRHIPLSRNRTDTSNVGIEMSEQLRQDLENAREIIADEAHWTRRSYHRPASGKQAEQFCLMGACEQAIYMHNAESDTWDDLATDRLDKITDLFFDILGCEPSAWDDATGDYLDRRADGIFCSPEGWNDWDKRTHREVLDLFDTAIKRAVDE